MNRRLALTIGFGVLLGSRVAAAQAVGIGYQGMPYKAGHDATGINLGEGVMLHVGIGAEAGYDSNVFYTSSSSAQPVVSSAIIRTTAFAQIDNSVVGGGSPTGLSYSARAGLMYRRYTDDSNGVGRYQNAFMPSAGLSLSTNAGPWAFGLSDAFVRLEDPPYGAAGGGPIARDNNVASAQVAWAPGGGRISSTLRYTNVIDIFETGSGYEYANNLGHTLLLDVAWKWLPKTAIFLQFSQGWVTYLNSAAETTGTGKHDSYPLHAILGVRGLVTPKVSAVASVGYGNAFYSSGVTTSGWGNTYLDLQATIVPTMLSRIVLGYHQDFQNSVISSFYYDYSLYASYTQQIAGRMTADISARYSHRRYEGLLFDPSGRQRNDNIFVVGATLDYFVRSWIFGGVGYSMAADLSDYTLPGGAPVDYVKHQVFARLGVTY